MADKAQVNSLVQKAMRFEEPSKKRPDPSNNLGKFLHAKKSPVNDGSKDPNAAGSKVRPGF